MRIGKLAALAGITPSRVRFYESEGLLPRPARRDSGYRDYDGDALDVLSLINRARRLGYTLKEIASYLNTPHEAARQSMLAGCVEGKLAEIATTLSEAEDRLTSLQELREKLRAP